MATMWQANELERRTAARLATAGFVPFINVKDPGTRSEFDIYAFLPRADGVERLLVQCSYPAPNSQKLAALRGYAEIFGAPYTLFVTCGKPHDDQIELARKFKVVLLSEAGDANMGCGVVAERKLDVVAPLSCREKAIVSYLRCVAWLRRVAYGKRHTCGECETTVSVWNKLDQVPLTRDPFERLCTLYDLHFSFPTLSQECASAESLAPTPRGALKEAYAYGKGTFTQSALAAQTHNRVQTLMALSECACLLAGGATLPSSLHDRRSKFIRELAQRPFRHLLGLFAFLLVHEWGGFWHNENEAAVKERIASHVGVAEQDIDQMIEFANRLFPGDGQPGFMAHVRYSTAEWDNIVLLPYFAKGIGLRRVECGSKIKFTVFPWADWKSSSERLEAKCKAYEQER